MKKQLLFILPFAYTLCSCQRLARSTERGTTFSAIKEAAEKMSEKKSKVTITGKYEDTSKNTSTLIDEINETFSWKDEKWECDNSDSDYSFVGIYALNLKYSIQEFEGEDYTYFKGISTYRIDYSFYPNGASFRYNKKGNPIDAWLYDGSNYKKLTIEFKFK